MVGFHPPMNVYVRNLQIFISQCLLDSAGKACLGQTLPFVKSLSLKSLYWLWYLRRTDRAQSWSNPLIYLRSATLPPTTLRNVSNKGRRTSEPRAYPSRVHRRPRLDVPSRSVGKMSACHRTRSVVKVVKLFFRCHGQ
jgi:hypothetical protein